MRALIFKEPWMRWYDLPGLRRVSLVRWSLRRKHWHPRAKRLARLRLIYWIALRGHATEICSICGGPVRLVFHAPDKVWERFAGFSWSNARSPGGEAAPGVLCPSCLDTLASEEGVLLYWTCRADDDSVMRG